MVSVAWRGLDQAAPQTGHFCSAAPPELVKIMLLSVLHLFFTSNYMHTKGQGSRVKGIVFYRQHTNLLLSVTFYSHIQVHVAFELNRDSPCSILEYAALHCPSHLCVSAVPCEKSGFTARRCVVAS